MSLNLVVFINSKHKDVREYWFGGNGLKFRILEYNKNEVQYEQIFNNTAYTSYTSEYSTNHNLYIKDDELHWESFYKLKNEKCIDKYKILGKVKGY